MFKLGSEDRQRKSAVLHIVRKSQTLTKKHAHFEAQRIYVNFLSKDWFFPDYSF